MGICWSCTSDKSNPTPDDDPPPPDAAPSPGPAPFSIPDPDAAPSSVGHLDGPVYICGRKNLEREELMTISIHVVLSSKNIRLPFNLNSNQSSSTLSLVAEDRLNE
ncbi:unnamed protein product [Dovyalis caffra]|uniref:Uncharacterized protein n=1 Tax=Dovyalis caffra TaxID=77055 RepID=A0AAV1S2I9_9ROSI|nr:unnamed protein product [Dovyalis caffra]